MSHCRAFKQIVTAHLLLSVADMALVLLAPEILDAIVLLADVSCFVDLARTNRLLNSVCICRMYRTIRLSDARKAVMCLKTLVASHEIASNVWRLAVYVPL